MTTAGGELMEFAGENGRLEYADGAVVPVSAFQVSELEEGARVQVTVADPRVIGEGLGAQDSPRLFVGTTPNFLGFEFTGTGGEVLRVTSEQPPDRFNGPLTAEFDISNCSFAGAIRLTG
jgi:hypothetical protein